MGRSAPNLKGREVGRVVGVGQRHMEQRCGHIASRWPSARALRERHVAKPHDRQLLSRPLRMG